MGSPDFQDKRRIKGFTLIELLVTLAIAAVLLSVGVPSFQQFIASQRVKTTADDIFTTLLFARSEAIKRNQNVIVSAIAGDWNKGWEVTASISGSDAVLRSSPANAGTAITPAAGATSVTYDRTGRTSEVTFAICDTNSSEQVQKRVVAVDNTGRPNISLSGSCS